MAYKYNGSREQKDTKPKRKYNKNNGDSVELDFAVKDKNGNDVKVTGYATPLNDKIKLSLYFNGVCCRGVAIRFYEGDPFLCYPRFKNKNNEYINLFYIQDSTLKENIISAVLGAC